MNTYTDIDLNDNDFRIIPEDIRYCTLLTRLHMKNNKLTELPTWLGELQELESFNVEANQVVELPSDLTQCAKLKVDYILIAVFECRNYLIKLSIKVLFIGGNQIATLPSSFARAFSELTRVTMTSNPLDLEDETTKQVFNVLKKLVDKNNGRFM